MTNPADTLDPDDPADRRWRELLRAADPVAESPPTDSDAWQAALARLHASATKRLEIVSLNDTTNNNDDNETPAATRAADAFDSAPRALSRRHPQWNGWGLALLAATLLGLVGAWWWFAPQWQNTGAVAERQAGEAGANTEPRPAPRSQTPMTESVVQSSRPPTDHDQPADHDQQAATNTGQRKAKIQSVQQLIKLRPSQLAAVQRQLDPAALDAELRVWLQQWDAATPANRAALEGQWVECRGFWVGWTLQGLREWHEPAVLRAGLEVLSLEFGPRAAEALAFCWQRPATRALARPVLLPRADESQLAQWLWAAEEADDLQALVTELAQRPGAVATQALATLAAEPGCQPVLRQAARHWSPQHLQRALADLSSPQPQTQFLAAMLLTALPAGDVEGELQRKIALGNQVLPALAVLLLRYNQQVPAQAQSLFQSTTVAAALPSARQRAQKWLRQQHAEFSDSTPLRKVCQQCVTEI